MCIRSITFLCRSQGTRGGRKEAIILSFIHTRAVRQASVPAQERWETLRYRRVLEGLAHVDPYIPYQIRVYQMI